MGDCDLPITDASKDSSRLFFEDAENYGARQPNTLAPGPQVNQDGEQLTLGTNLEEDTLEWSGGQLTRDEVKLGIKQENTSDSEWTEHLTTDEVKLGIKQEDMSDSEWTEHLPGEEVKLRIKQENSSDSEWTVEGPQDLEESGWIEEHFTGGEVKLEIKMEEETSEPDEDGKLMRERDKCKTEGQIGNA